MYQLFGIKTCLTAFAMISGAVALLFWWWMPPADLAASWRIVSSSVTIVAVLTTLIGQTPAFPWVCRLPGVRWLFPDIDGQWRGTMESNWPVIMERSGLLQPGAAPPSGVIPADFTIKARLFFVRINQTSANGYTSSKTLFVRASRDPEDGELRLSYLYEATTLQPEVTNSGKHHGAGYIDLKEDGRGDQRFEGVYWTNRNWHPNALNTAGKIVLRRV
jgi:hypothetical protein